MLRRISRVCPTFTSLTSLHIDRELQFSCWSAQSQFKMSHCHDEHEHHGHGHSEGAVHDHTDDITPALQNHIYEQIDFSAINTLNESESRAGSKVVQKTWTERLEPNPELCSDADEQLLMHVPYVENRLLQEVQKLMTTKLHSPDTSP